MEAALRYQLVLQFTAEDITDFDELVAAERKLIEQLSGFGFVDGHDYGESQFNIFILTDDPVTVFKKVQQVIRSGSNRTMRAAYRIADGEDYIILWPPGITEFTIS